MLITNTNKGITLVALVITIIIIIILSTITISTVLGDNGLINTAKKTKGDAESFVNNENEKMGSLLDEYANIMAEDSDIPLPDEPWHYDEDGNITNGKVTLGIGDYVNYDCTTSNASYTSLSATNGYEDQIFTAASYQYGWRILGLDETTGELLIVSEDFVQPISGGYK